VLAPTVARLADVLRRENWTPSWSSLVPMRAGGSKSPLFLIHAHGGNVLEYQPLVKQLEADQPVYALQARSLDGSICEGHTLEEMAAAYLQEIRSLQPGGPYFLGGFCFGGLVALEAAQQLLAAGEQVGLLVLIQTMNPEVARFAPNVGLLRQWWYRTAKRFDLERDNFSARGIGYFGDRCRDLADVLQARGAIALDTMTGNVHSGKRSLRYILESLRIEHAKAYAKYQMRSYPGDTLLLRASKQLSGLMIDETSGWKSAVRGKLEVREIQGHQQTMLQEPNVSDVAQILTERLQAAQTARGNSKTAAAQ
jgi:thioesterase domain-containing protein